MNDKTIITIGQKSHLNIIDYLYDEKKPKESKAEFQFLKGSFKSITGAIGKINKERFKLKTKSSTIGIRGTTVIADIGEIEVILCTEGAIEVALIGVPIPPVFVESGEFTKAVGGELAPAEVITPIILNSVTEKLEVTTESEPQIQKENTQEPKNSGQKQNNNKQQNSPTQQTTNQDPTPTNVVNVATNTTNTTNQTNTDETLQTATSNSAILTISSNPIAINEGQTVTFTVTSSVAPTQDLVVNMTSGESVTILAGNTSASFNVTTTSDIFLSNNLSKSILSVSGGRFNSVSYSSIVTTTVNDVVDTTAIILTSTNQTAIDGTTSSIVYSATVPTAPQTDMSLTLANGETITIPAGQTSGIQPLVQQAQIKYQTQWLVFLVVIMRMLITPQQ